jgi:hypothetical protein
MTRDLDIRLRQWGSGSGLHGRRSSRAGRAVHAVRWQPRPANRLVHGRRWFGVAALSALIASAMSFAGGSYSLDHGVAYAGTTASSGKDGQRFAATSQDPAPARVKKILVIMEENHSVDQVFPNAMPYLWSVAQQYGRATAWSDVGHPSLPNYLAIASGSAFNDPQDCAPAPGCTYPGPTVFGQALARGETARSYEESMPTPCDLGYSGEYDVNHNPWAYFPSEAKSCRANDLASGTPTRGALAAATRTGSLPNVGLVTPNLVHDAHDGTLAEADAWLRSWLPVLMSGPDWRTGRLAIAVVFDEGQTTEQVPFVLLVRGLNHVVVNRSLDHYALTRLIGEIAGTPLLRNATHAVDITQLFGLNA